MGRRAQKARQAQEDRKRAAAAAAPSPPVPKKRKKSAVPADQDEEYSLDMLSSMNHPHAPQHTPLRLNLKLGKRCTAHGYAESLRWTCDGCGKVNQPRRGLVADYPVLQCDCGREANVDFDFSLASVKINGQSPVVQENVKLQKSDDCILCATASNIEISLRMQAILSGQKVEGNQPIINLTDLHDKYERIRKRPGINKERKWDEDTIIVLASIAKIYGVVTKEEEPKLHKLPEYVRVKNNFYDIVRVLADGYPLTTGFIHGKNFRNLKPGQIYKAPREEKLTEGKSRTGHSILLIGAGRRRNTNYYHFINSWGTHFCLEDGGRYGFGMIRASDIRSPPVKFLRYEEDIKYHNMLASTDLTSAEGAESKEGVFAECPKPVYGSFHMAVEMPLHDLPQDCQSYEMEQFPQNLCESSSMQVGSGVKYCGDTSLSNCYMDVSSPESLSCEQNQSKYIGFKSESSTDSSPVTSRSCFGANANGYSDFSILSSHGAPGQLFPLQGELNNLQQSLSANPVVPRFGGMPYKTHDERVTLRNALQDISQPKSEANPPDGVLSVPLLRHQKIVWSWMLQKERISSHCSGIRADDQGPGKTISAISLILTERSLVPRSFVIKQEPCKAVTLDDDTAELCLKKRPYTCSSEVASTTVKLENHILEPISRNPITGYKKVEVVSKTVMLRQTKAVMLDGKPIMSLLLKTIHLKAVNSASEECAFYNTLEAEPREQFKVYPAAGTVKQNYVDILLMLLRLRQACDHPHLVKGHASSWTSSLEAAKKLLMERQQEMLVCLQSCSAICALCNDAPEDAVVTLRGHVFCNQCILEQLTGDGNICPVPSNLPVTVSRLTRLTVKDTVEDGILALQEKKKEVASAFGEDKPGGGQTRLIVVDLNCLFIV